MNPQDIPALNPSQPVGTPQTQAIERLRTAVNVLVTVSNNPTVDQLAAAIGFTLTLNKIGKHATAVYSGDTPSTLEFLKPEATIEKNTDSLRDFIVSLDKAKADKLRYKVEENVVKIFITPYRTSLSEKDLNFSQGDFNVDAVVALGVSEREQLDQAIIAHGRILHDATVITVSAGSVNSTLGSVNWQDSSASSLCEMLVSVGDALQPGLLDNQIATAYLTGIVAQTERFRNDKTTPKIMTMAASLMAAGANQQLIASSLEQVTEVPLKPTPIAAPETAPVSGAENALTIDHDILPESGEQELSHPQIAIDEHGNMGQTEKKPLAVSGHRLIETPPPPLVPEKSNEEIFSGGTHSFSANLTAEDEDLPSTNILAPPSLPGANTMLEHDKDDNHDVLPSVADNPAPDVEPAVDNTAELDIPPAETFPPALDTNTLRDLEMTFDSKHIAEDPHSTLNEIEEVVDSPHLKGEETQPQGTLDSARGAVQSAIYATPYDPTRPQPTQALNATALPLPISAAAPMPPNDPVLAGLGLTDNTGAPSVSVLPPAPTVFPPSAVAIEQDSSGQTPPPVPPPLLPLQ